MRAENLRHAATGVIVRDPWGRVYVHRRTPTKDVYPAHWDFTAGGVVLAGEDPLDAARRELAEELGVTSELESLGEADYADSQTVYHAFRFVTTWDGPITPQASEVAYGAWLSIERLLERIADPEIAFMPDSVELFADWLRARAAERAEPIQGWDSVATLIEGRWIDRVPQYPDAATQLANETRLMPRIAPLLPLEVPVPVMLEEEPLRVRHPLVVGDLATDRTLTADDGLRMGQFLRALHDMPLTLYIESGIPDQVAARAELLATLERLLHRVLPLTPEELHGPGSALLRRVALKTPTTVIHGDLGPHHVRDPRRPRRRRHRLVGRPGRRSGDRPRLGALRRRPSRSRRPSRRRTAWPTSELARAFDWWRLAPWYDVLWGPAADDPALVESGLAEIATRLTT